MHSDPLGPVVGSALADYSLSVNFASGVGPEAVLAALRGAEIVHEFETATKFKVGCADIQLSGAHAMSTRRHQPPAAPVSCPAAQSAQPWLLCWTPALLRVRVEIMGLIMIRTD
jgi:hypothetical protein